MASCKPVSEENVGGDSFTTSLTALLKQGGVVTPQQLLLVRENLPLLLKHLREGQEQDSINAGKQLEAYINIVSEDRKFWSENVAVVHDLYKHAESQEEKDKLFEMLKDLQDRFAQGSLTAKDHVKEAVEDSREYKKSTWNNGLYVFSACIVLVGAGALAVVGVRRS